MDKFHAVAEQGVAHVRVWSHSASVCEDGRLPTVRGETRERSLSGRTNSDGWLKHPIDREAVC